MNSKHPTQGVIRNGDITTFTLKSTLATSIELCCFDDTGRQRIHLMDKIHEDTFSLTLEGIKAGQRYGYRVHGPWNPSKGEFCNPAKLLLDPYAKQLSGRFHGHASCYSHASKPDHHNSARFVPKSVVVEDHFDWQGVTKPKTPWSKTCIMELHVKGFTARHPDIAPEIRGTYRALWSKPILEHFKACGVTAIELLPVQAFDHDPFLTDKNLTNYWGYMTLAYFAPHRAYASEDGPGAVEEFKEMVRELHRAGIEVILDVVYNHHLEGNRHGPILSLKGIDAPAYYHMDPTQKEPFVDFTGCGNTLNAAHPLCHDLIQTSLKYWHEDMQVDGFRFDEAPAMSRQLDGKIELQPFCDAVQASCPDAN